jgi:hypothetical protein
VVPTVTALTLLLAPVCRAAPTPPTAWLGSVTWTTYLHEGPGQEYRTEDELETGSRVAVVDCANRWCRVVSGDRIGFLPQMLLRPVAAAPPPPPPAPADCFDARRAGYRAGQVFQYCPK